MDRRQDRSEISALTLFLKARSSACCWLGRYKRKRAKLPRDSRSVGITGFDFELDSNRDKMKSLLAAVFFVGVLTAHAQIYNPALNLVSESFNNQPPLDPASLVHRAVAENAAREAQLPPELLNPFYKNPRIAAGLAKESWFANKEFPIFHREAENIPRSQIAKIIHNAGFDQQRRRRRYILY